MIKDKIIELANGFNYYILEEIIYNNKKYVLAVLCNLEKDEIDKEKYLVLEIKAEATELVTSDIEDEELATTVTKLLLDKVRKNN